MRSIITGISCVIATLAFDKTSDKKPAPPGVYKNPAYGFAMDTPNFPVLAKKKQGIVATFAAPPANHHVAEIKVLVHSEAISAAKFLDFTQTEVERLTGAIGTVSWGNIDGRDSVIFEYDIFDGGIALRCLGLAVADKGRVYFVSGTAKAENYDRYEPAFRATLESFRFDKD